MTVNKYKYIVTFIYLISSLLQAQNDTIRLINNDIIVGEIKSLHTGVLIIDTFYGVDDFKIEFEEVQEVYLQRKCHIILKDGRRRFGNIKTDNTGVFIITLETGAIEFYTKDEITAIVEVEDKFWERLSASIDLSYNFTKTNNDAQLNISGELDYINKKILFESKINILRSTQDNTDNIKRTDANLNLKRLISKKWYLLGEFSFLKNTEQALEGRFSPNIGVGRFLINTNKLYFGASIGYAYIIENYVDSSLDKTSTEIHLSSDFNLYNLNDFELKTSIKFYPSLSEKGRIRTDYDLTVKYDLPLDFYIKLGCTLNYDNQPAIVGNELDYIFNTGLGWKFN